MTSPHFPIELAPFQERVTALFERILEELETSYGSFFEEMDIKDGHLELVPTGPQAGTFLITRHGPTRQIWYASPVSGATHFQLTASGWASTQNPQVTFPQLLMDELTRIIGQKVSLSHVS